MPGAIKSGCLYLVGTPIGNLEDISQRAVRVLRQVDVVAAEDTRTARKLLSHCEVPVGRRLTSYFKGNEERRGEELAGRLAAGASVALITESGMPGVSDPGTRLVRRCVEAGIEVDCIPGPSAALGALVISGLPTDRFTFLGFLPRRGRARQQALDELAHAPGTLILYEAPGRVGATLCALNAALGPRAAVLVRELTKLHQEVVRGDLDQLARRFAETPPRGEVTLVVAGADGTRTSPPVDLEAEIHARLARGESPRDVAEALREHGRRTVYQIALRLRP